MESGLQACASLYSQLASLPRKSRHREVISPDTLNPLFVLRTFHFYPIKAR